jgi:hypothetical protein
MSRVVSARAFIRRASAITSWSTRYCPRTRTAMPTCYCAGVEAGTL